MPNRLSFITTFLALPPPSTNHHREEQKEQRTHSNNNNHRFYLPPSPSPTTTHSPSSHNLNPKQSRCETKQSFKNSLKFFGWNPCFRNLLIKLETQQNNLNFLVINARCKTKPRWIILNISIHDVRIWCMY